MRTERSADSAPIDVSEALAPRGRTLSDDVEAFVDSANSLELMAFDLAQRNVDETEAIRKLVEAAVGDVRVMRRAHRHCEQSVSDQWPAGQTLIRAFDYLSAGRREMESEASIRKVVPQPSIAVRTQRRPPPTEHLSNLVDEASIDSFPASDAPSFWAR